MKKELEDSFVFFILKGQLSNIKMYHLIGEDIHFNDDIALIIATKENNLEIVKFLVSNNANIHTRNNLAFQIARENNFTQILDYLTAEATNTRLNNEISKPNNQKKITI